MTDERWSPNPHHRHRAGSRLSTVCLQPGSAVWGFAGWVRNTSAGVDIEVDGAPESLRAFVRAVRDEAPPLSRIDDLDVSYQSAHGFVGFEILRFRKHSRRHFSPSRRMWRSAKTVFVRWAILKIAAFATPSSTAPTAVRASRSSRISPMIARDDDGGLCHVPGLRARICGSL